MYARIAFQEKNQYADLVAQEDTYAIGCGAFPITVEGEGKLPCITAQAAGQVH